MPVVGLAHRVSPYRATVRVYNAQGDVDERFEVSFRVDENITTETFSLTLRATPGGRVAMGNLNYANQWTAEFQAGTEVHIHARSNSGFSFDFWSVSPNVGRLANTSRDSTAFIMPNRNVTITAHFWDGWDRWGRWDRWDPRWGWDWPDRWDDPLWDRWDSWDPRWTTANRPTVIFPAPSIPVTPPPSVGVMPPPVAIPDLVPITPAPMPVVPAPVVPAPAPVPVAPATPAAQEATAAAGTLQPLAVNVNGTRIYFAGQPAGIIGDTAFVPVSALFQHLGYTVSWNAATQSATLQRGSVTLVVTAGSQTFVVNGSNRTLSAAPAIINGNLMVPAEIIESVGGLFYRDTSNVLQIFARL
jgi:hypothetical protein